MFFHPASCSGLSVLTVAAFSHGELPLQALPRPSFGIAQTNPHAAVMRAEIILPVALALAPNSAIFELLGLFFRLGGPEFKLLDAGAEWLRGGGNVP
jgi:hypothetical protein